MILYFQGEAARPELGGPEEKSLGKNIPIRYDGLT
jgi:hypothetical protein